MSDEPAIEQQPERVAMVDGWQPPTGPDGELHTVSEFAGVIERTIRRAEQTGATALTELPDGQAILAGRIADLVTRLRADLRGLLADRLIGSRPVGDEVAAYELSPADVAALRAAGDVW